MSTPPAPAPSAPGNPAVDLTRDTEGHELKASEPKLAHDRDETVGTTDGKKNDIVEQAGRDVNRGLEDTSRGAESDDTYKKQK